ncbi:hypothetical protein [Niabella sp.]|uniref:hypothetical protein n=1 Tax=Niabella sp. TaxID=1962976 RepID=UPI00262BC15B|nr:hypothetical protein [Niabella sp.]
MSNIDELLEDIIAAIEDESNKNYWLIRSQGGTLYSNFLEVGYVGLEHDGIDAEFIKEISEKHINSGAIIKQLLKVKINEYANLNLEEGEDLSARALSLIVNQVYKFMYTIKSGDIVVCPSANSDFISIGEIVGDTIDLNISNEERRRMEVKTPFIRRVKWKKHVSKMDIDPYFYRMFTAHQALNDAGAYAEVIERTLKDVFYLDNETHFIINVSQRGELPAKDIFGMGYNLLSLLDEVSIHFNLNISSDQLASSINLNSPGKIDLKSKIKKATLMAGIILFICGGGYESKEFTLKTDGLPGVLKSINDFINESNDRKMKKEIFEKYKDSLSIKAPEDLINLLKQVDRNKDIAK